MKAFLLSLFLLFSFTTLFSQKIDWEKSYGGKHADYLFDAIATPDYGFILAGSSLSKKTGKKTDDNNGDLDYWIWKMDEKGDLDWQKSFGGSGADLLQSIRLTPDAGFILGGTSTSEKGFHKKDSCKGQADFWILKLDAKGNEQWQKTIGGTSDEQLQSVIPTKDGGYIVCGSSSSDKRQTSETEKSNDKTLDSFGNLDYWIVKLDKDGKMEWQRTLGGVFADVARSIVATDDDGFLIGGYSNSPESGNKSEKNYGQGDYWVVKLDKEGAVVWQKVYGGENDDQLYVVHQTNDGNFILAGNSNSGTSGNKNASNKKGTDFWLVKIDPLGEIIWQKTYDIGKVDLLSSLLENEDGTMLLGGYAKSETMGSMKKDQEDINDYVALKIDAEGEELWRKSVGSSDEDLLRKAFETRDGGYLLAGTSNGKASRDKKSSIGSNDFWVVKLKDDKKPEKEKLKIEALPNPTAAFTNVVVGYDFENGTATLVDMAGRQLQSFAITDRTVPIDLSGLPDGIYIVNIKTNVQSDGVKVMKKGSN